MLYIEYENLLEEIKNCSAVNELEDILSKMESLDFTLKIGVTEPKDWKTSPADFERYKKLLQYPLSLKIKSHPNYLKIKNVKSLIEEANFLMPTSNTTISNFLRKVEKSFGLEIGFPASTINKFKSDDISARNGFKTCSINKDDLSAVIMRLEGYLEEISIIKKESNNSKNNSSQEINIYTSAQATNQIKIDISLQIENINKEIEEDDNLTEEQINECKKLLEDLQEVKNKKQKHKWEKCKEILVWLGDKTVKFAEWFIPIMATILSNK